MAAMGPSQQTISGPDAWIIATSLDKPDQQTRTFIRRHVMRGKNTREYKRSKKSTKVAVSYDGPFRSNRPYKPGTAVVKYEEDEDEDEEWAIATPRRIASELACSSVAGAVKASGLGFLQRAIIAVQPSDVNLEINIVEGARDDFFGFDKLCESPVLVQCMLFMSQVFQDTYSNIPYSKASQMYLTKTLKLLQQSLDNEKDAKADSTVAVVSSLASASMLLGDLEAASKHIDGMYQIIGLRGGLKSLDRGILVDEKAQRIDFGIAVSTGGRMRFLRDDVCWSPDLASGRSGLAFPELSMIHPRPDPRLLNTWLDCRAFSVSANKAAATKVKMPLSVYTRFTTSTPSRLMQLEFDTSSSHELLRLSMLAYLKANLCQMKGFGKHVKYLSYRLKIALLAQHALCDAEMDKLLLWAAYMAAISVFEDDDRTWLRDILIEKSLSLGLRSWYETKTVLKNFLWIDISLDPPGQEIFNEWPGVEKREL